MNNGLANVGICFQFYRVTVAIVHSPFLTIILPSVWCFRFADKLIRSLLSFHRFLFFYHCISIAMSSLFFYQFNNFFIYNHLIFNFSSSSNACARARARIYHGRTKLEFVSSVATTSIVEIQSSHQQFT